MQIAVYSENKVKNNQSFAALPSKYKMVTDELIRGPHPHIKDLIQLKKEGVNQIFDFRHDCVRGFKWVEKLACKILGINYQRRMFSFFNKRPKLEDFEAVASEVAKNKEKGGKTLFHCNSGSHRTALFSTFYAVTKGESLAVVKSTQDYTQKASSAVNEQILNTRFFTRNTVNTTSLNPIVRLKNNFNNKVVKNTKEALNEFLAMINYEPKTCKL